MTDTPETAPVETTTEAAVPAFANAKEAAKFLIDRQEKTQEEHPSSDDSVETIEVSGTDDSETHDPEPEVSEEPELFTVKVNGAEHKVTLEELQKGYSRQEDYSRKTAELAREREKSQTDAEKQKAQYLAAAQQALYVAQNGLDPVIADWQRLGPDGRAKLAQQDPATFTAKRAQFEERAMQLTQMQTDFEAHKKQSLQESLVEEHKKLVERVPEWKDGKTLEKDITAVGNFLIKSGFSKQMVDETIDHRIWEISRKAYLYDKQQEAKRDLTKNKVPPPPTRVTRPGTGDAKNEVGMSSYRKQLEQAKKSGDYKAIARVMASKPSN